MAEPVSIAERILRQLALNAADATGAGTVYRWDSRGLTDYDDSDLIVVDMSEDGVEGPQGNTGWTDKLLTVLVGAIMRQDEKDTESSDIVRKRWHARIEAAILADPTVTEDVTGVRLAWDMRWIGCGEPEKVDAVVDAAVTFEVRYRTVRNNPYASDTAAQIEE